MIKLVGIFFSFLLIMIALSCQNQNDALSFDENLIPQKKFLEDYDFYVGQGEDYTFFSSGTKTKRIIQCYDSLMACHPGYITKQCIGKACDDQDLISYEFCGDSATSKIFIICAQHGFEKSSTYGTFYFLRDVCDHNDDDEFLDYVYHHLHLIVVPVVNPSGFDTFIYKNANGVNLNRNWPVVDWRYDDDFTSSSYSGLYPLDQPETRAVDSLVNEHLDAKLFIDFHTNGMGVLEKAKHINWLSLAYIENNTDRNNFLYIANEQLDRVTVNFKKIYGPSRPILNESSLFGYITISKSYSRIGMAEVSMPQRGMLALTFEGFNGFPGDSKPFLPDVAKANSELLGNFLYLFCSVYCTE